MPEEHKPDEPRDPTPDTSAADDMNPSTDSPDEQSETGEQHQADASQDSSDASEQVAPGKPDSTLSIDFLEDDQSDDESTKLPSFRIADCILASLLVVLAFLAVSFPLSSTRVFLDLAAGKQIASGDYQFGVDPFSFATEGVYWVNHSWLYDLILYGFYSTFPSWVLVAIKALLASLIVVCLLQIHRRGQGLLLPLFATTLAILPLSLYFRLDSSVVSYLFLAVTLYLLTRQPPTDDSRSMRHLWVLPPLFAVWVNMDEAFLLGPMTVALYLVGLLFTSRSPEAKGQVRTLSLVFLASLAACLLNPHHIRAFRLSPDVGYVLVNATAPLSIELPDWLAGGGKTLYAITQGDPDRYQIFSPFSTNFVRSTEGLNVAGTAYFLLVALGFLSFAVPLFASKSSPWNWARFLVWLFFAMLSFSSTRLMGYFAIAAAPITVLNFQDLVAERNYASPKPAGLGRVALAMAFIVMIFLVWPGWLHGKIGDWNLPRRVSWQFDADPSLKEAAEHLNEVHKSEGLKRGFNYTFDIGNYCAWACPDVKTFIDQRYGLFPSAAKDFAVTKRALREHFQPGKTPQNAAAPQEWIDLVKKYGIDHLLLRDYRKSSVRQMAHAYEGEPQKSRRGLMYHRGQWPFLYGDGRTLIFGWRDNQGDALPKRRVDLAAQAFGEPKADSRPPQDGAKSPLIRPGLWAALEPEVSNTALAADEIPLLINLYNVRLIGGKQAYAAALLATAWTQPLTGVSGPVTLATARKLEVLRLTEIPFLEGSELSAAALLAMRAGRRAVAENPYFAPNRQALVLGTEFLRGHEYRLSPGRPDPRSVRLSPRKLRQIALVNGLESYLALATNDPNRYRQYILLGNIYASELHYLDLAEECYSKALDILSKRTVDSDNEKEIAQLEREMKQVKALRKQVGLVTVIDRQRRRLRLVIPLKYRVQDFERMSAKQAPLTKAFLAVMQRPYFHTSKKNQRIPDQYGFGLAGRALDLLSQIDIGKLEPKQKRQLLALQLRLALQTGKAQEVYEACQSNRENLLKTLGINFYVFEALACVAVGDYQTFDADVAELVKRSTYDGLEKNVLLWQTNLQLPTIPYLTNLTKPLLSQLMAVAFQRYAATVEEVGQLQLCRGLMALEGGDTDKAMSLLEDVINRTRALRRFDGRDVARRYLRFLREQHAKGE